MILVNYKLADAFGMSGSVRIRMIHQMRILSDWRIENRGRARAIGLKVIVNLIVVIEVSMPRITS